MRTPIEEVLCSLSRSLSELQGALDLSAAMPGLSDVRRDLKSLRGELAFQWFKVCQHAVKLDRDSNVNDEIADLSGLPQI